MNRELKKLKKCRVGRKSLIMIFHPLRVKIPDPVTVKFGREKIQHENYVKVLGVFLDANLSCKHHVNELSKKLSRTSGLFYKIRHYVPLEILKQIYYTLYLLFCLIWNYCLGCYLQVTCSERN